MTAERLLRLLSLFTVRRCCGGEELAQRLDVTPRTIRRDVEIARPAPTGTRPRVLVAAPADVVAARMPGLGAVVEAVSESACLVISGHHYLDALALYFAALDLPFTPLEPPELRERCAELSRRLGEAAAGGH